MRVGRPTIYFGIEENFLKKRSVERLIFLGAFHREMNNVLHVNKMEAKIPIRIEYKSLADMAYRIIRDKILICELEPGSKIVEEKLAQEMGISRTPLRKALTKLEKEEFIVVVPRKGTYVKKLSPKEIKEIYELRRLLEGFAAEEAAYFINRDQLKKMRELCKSHKVAAKKNNLLSCLIYNIEFHKVLVEASKNGKLLKVLNGFHLQLQAMRLRDAKYSRGIMETQEEVINEHLAIIEALSKGDGKLARRLVEEHIIRDSRRINHPNGYLKLKVFSSFN